MTDRRSLSPRARYVLLAAILLLAAGIRVGTADYGLWFDEIASTVFARQPLSHLWGAWMVRETNPPLFYTLLKGWTAVFGDTDFALRLLSVTIGLAGIALAWALAARVGGAVAGLLAALLLALAMVHVDFSQEVRGYILTHTATLAALLAMTDYLRVRRWRSLVGYGVAALVALYCHTTMIVFVILANVAMVIVLYRDRRALAAWIGTNGVVAIGWAWWIGITLVQLSAARNGADWIARPSVAAALRMAEGIYLPGDALVPGETGGALLLAAAIAGVVVSIWRDRRAEIVLLAIPALGAPLLLFVVSQITPIFTTRTLFWASGPWVVLVAVAVTRGRVRSGMTALVLVLLACEAIVLARWIPQREEEDWRTPLAMIAHRRRDAVLIVQGDAIALAADRYRAEIAPALRLRVVPGPAGRGDAWGDGLSSAPHLAAAAAAPLLRRAGTLYTYRRGDSDPAPLLRRAGVERRLTDPPTDRQPYVSRWDVR